MYLQCKLCNSRRRISGFTVGRITGMRGPYEIINTQIPTDRTLSYGQSGSQKSFGQSRGSKNGRRVPSWGRWPLVDPGRESLVEVRNTKGPEYRLSTWLKIGNIAVLHLILSYTLRANFDPSACNKERHIFIKKCVIVLYSLIMQYNSIAISDDSTESHT